MALKKYTPQATRIAVKYNNPRLPRETWANELGISLKKFQEYPDVFSWGQALALERAQREAKKK